MKETRSYNSPRRRQEALKTRREILDAALALFSERDHGRVTVPEIAERAGVAVRTVYLSVGGKAEVLSAVIARGAEYSGGHETLERVRAAADPGGALRTLVHGTRAGNETQRAVIALARRSALDEDGRAVWENATAVYRDLLREAAAHLDSLGALAPGVSVREAEHMLWFCLGFDAWAVATRDLGLDWDAAEEWLHARTAALLFGGNGEAP